MLCSVEVKTLTEVRDVVNLKRLTQLSVTVLDCGTPRHTKLLTSRELCGKRTSFSIELRLQTVKITLILLQIVNSGERVTVTKHAPSFEDLEWYRGVKGMDQEMSNNTIGVIVK